MRLTQNRKPHIAIIVALQEEFHTLFGGSNFVPNNKIPNRLGRWYDLQMAGVSNVIVTFLGAMGPAKAIEFTTRFLEHHKPSLLINIGISGTFSSDVRLGDVVVASLTDLYEDAAAIEEVDLIPYLKPSGRPIETEDFKDDVDHFRFAHARGYAVWQEACVKNRSDFIGSVIAQIPPALLVKDTNLHSGHLACAGEVIKSKQWKHNLLRRDRKYLAVDMESAGVAIPAREARRAGMKILIVRGISDPADDRKEQLDSLGGLEPGALRRLALHNAAEFLKVFLPTVVTAGARTLQKRTSDKSKPRQKRQSANPYADRLGGKWKADFTYVDGETYTEIVEIYADDSDRFAGRIVPSIDNCKHTGVVDHLTPLRLRGSLNGTPMLTGTWYHSSRPELHGAFQLRFSSESDGLRGGWLMFSDSRNKLISGEWQWVRQVPRTKPVVGIYGITGAGKTALCQQIVAQIPGARYFSESEIIDDYMRRFESGDLESFKAKSESERMNAREAAFVFHYQRVRNSDGLLFGDAHFAFPANRLGRIERPHSEAEHGIQPVMPQSAWNVYGCIIYLNTPVRIIKERLTKSNDLSQRNAWMMSLSVGDMQQWIDYERQRLILECSHRGKQFLEISGEGTLVDLATRLSNLLGELREKVQ
jgi:nucleoside phosphorylase